MVGKKRPIAHIRGESGVNILKKKIPPEWVAREYVPDYGIDLSIEIFEPYEENYITKGEHIFFQVKTTEHIEKKILKIKSRDNIEKTFNNVYRNSEEFEIEVIKYSIDTDLLATVEKMGSAIPVILAVVDASTENIYFVCLNDYIEKVIVPQDINYTEKQTKTINIPTKNILDKDGIKIIEWYAKRPKLYALFNKINYQRRELEYCYGNDIEERIEHFIKIIKRSDAWSACEYFSIMADIKEDIEYYMQCGKTKEEENSIRCFIENKIDVDEAVWENSHFAGLASLRECHHISSLVGLWNKLLNLGDLFEDVIKEEFLPTPLSIVMSSL